MATRPDLRGVPDDLLRRFALDCVEHVLGDDCPPLCRRTVDAGRAAQDRRPPDHAALQALRREIEAAVAPARALWDDRGVPALALGATLSALADDPAAAAGGAAVAAQGLAAQRAYARSAAQGVRDRGDDADLAGAEEAKWQVDCLDSLRR